MLRIAFFLLLALNVVLLGLGLGGIGQHDRREPERLAQQLEPEKLAVLPAGSAAPPPAAEAPAALATAPAAAAATASAATASAATATAPAGATAPAAPPAASATPAAAPAPPAPTAPTACWRWTDLAAPQAASLAEQAAARALGVERRELPPEPPTSWWVYIPPAASRADADKRVAALRTAGITDLFIVQDAGAFRHAISLGLFKAESMAKDLVERLRRKGVEDARIATRGGAPARTTVFVRGPQDGIDALRATAKGGSGCP